MIILKKVFFLIGFIVSNCINAQEIWSLEKCIDFALNKNLTVQQAAVQVDNAQKGERLANFSRYPTLSAGSNLGFNFGRTVNPSTNVFESNNSNFSSYGLSANILLYNGGRLQATYQQSAIDSKAATADLEQNRQTVALQVVQNYMLTLLSQEQLENAQMQLARSQKQLERLDVQIKAGVFSVNARYDLLAQMARIEQQIIIAQNTRATNLLNLKNTMQMPLNQSIRIEKPSEILPIMDNTEPNEENRIAAVVNLAMTNQAQIKAGELRIRSAQIGVKIAKAALMPTLSAQANLATNYANLITDPTKRQLTGTSNFDQNVRINGQNATITYTESSYETPKKSYGAQIRDNFGQSLGFNLSIPIFDGFSRKIAVERANLAVKNSQFQLEQTKQLLQVNVQNAIAAAEAGQKVYAAALKIVEAQKITFDIMDKRAQAGNANIFELAQTKIQLETAERDLIIAKYDYLFRLKIVDFYAGKNLGGK